MKRKMKKPSRSVTVGTLGGAITTVIISLLEANDIEVSPELASSLATLSVAVLAHFCPQPSQENES